MISVHSGGREGLEEGGGQQLPPQLAHPPPAPPHTYLPSLRHLSHFGLNIGLLKKKKRKKKTSYNTCLNLISVHSGGEGVGVGVEGGRELAARPPSACTPDPPPPPSCPTSPPPPPTHTRTCPLPAPVAFWFKHGFIKKRKTQKRDNFRKLDN